jgi:DNA replication protein DnaC
MGLIEDHCRARIRSTVEPFKDRALKFLTHRGLIKDNNLETLTPEMVDKITSILPYFTKLCLNYETPEEKAEREASEQAQRRAKIIERNLERLWQVTPSEFEHLTEQGAPRPKQFKFVSQFFSADDSPWHDAELRKQKHGLLLTGAPGTGKTATLYAMLTDALESEAVEDFEFVKSVRFFRLAKSKHLSDEARTEFVTLFNRMVRVQLLAMDDIGTEVISEGAQENVFELLDARLENWRFTALTTNCTPAQLAHTFGKNSEKMARRMNQFFLTVNFDTR